MKILSEKEAQDGYVDFEVELTEEEESVAFGVGKFLVPEESNKEKIIEAALIYFIVLGIINEEGPEA